MHHGPHSTKNSEYKNDCSCPIQSHILFISYPSWQSKKSVSKQHKSETSFASFVEIRRNFSVLKHFFDLTRMQTVLAFMAVETKANILWYSIHILEQNQTIAEPPGDKHFSSILFPSKCQSVYWECLTSIFHFFFLANPDIVLNPHNHGGKSVFASDTRSLESFRLPNHQPWLYHYIERFSKKLWKRLFKDWYFAVFFLPQPRLFYTDLFMHVLPYNIVCMFRFFQVLESEGLV